MTIVGLGEQVSSRVFLRLYIFLSILYDKMDGDSLFRIVSAFPVLSEPFLLDFLLPQNNRFILVNFLLTSLVFSFLFFRFSLDLRHGVSKL